MKLETEEEEWTVSELLLALFHKVTGWGRENWLVLACVVAFTIVLALFGGCFQPDAVQVAPPQVNVAVQPGAVPVQASASLGAVWDMLKDIEATIVGIQDQVNGIQAKVNAQVTQTVTVGKGTGGLQAALAGIGAAVLGLGALALYLNARKGHLGQVLNVLTDAIEQEGDNVGTKHRVAAQLEALPKAKLTLNRLLLRKGYLGQRGR